MCSARLACRKMGTRTDAQKQKKHKRDYIDPEERVKKRELIEVSCTKVLDSPLSHGHKIRGARAA